LQLNFKSATFIVIRWFISDEYQMNKSLSQNQNLLKDEDVYKGKSCSE